MFQNLLSNAVRTSLFASLAACLMTVTANAQSAGTIVDVGPGFAGADATAGGMWTHTDTDSRVGPGGSMGRGLAIGAGPNGLSLSHSIGVNHGGVGVGHNFNLSIGQNGTHVSHGGVRTIGGNSRVIAGGGTQQTFGGISGGSNVTGFGNHTHTHTGARTRRFFRRW
ncbi:hypothetical protein [Novipirellula artificiosorum]|uniref:Uncharacterized protein n=1 Tax=Novipirellula artificiosorum TaxID=2528016 RepID=A0A5C6CP24_9BACT|nr:hypothetical protein [Novipirellula artificiosorum]TWU24806.1 hypothetical protein Poly41_70840 [Novipirellula artificiosorum]